MKFFKYLLILGLVAFCVGCQKKDGSLVLARFDGDTITENQLLRKLATLPQDIRLTALKRKKEFLEDMASEHFLLKEAKHKGLEKDPDVVALIDAARRKIIVAKLIETEIDKKITLEADAASKYYEARKQDFMTQPVLRASHILVKTEEEATQIKNKLNQGADFEELARAKSMDATAQRGGDLGFFQKGQFVPEFEDKVLQMKKGEVSEPVKTRFGYHIIKLTDQMPSSLKEFKTVKRLIEERLVSEKRTEAFKKLVEKLRGSEKINVDEKALETFTKKLDEAKK